MALKYYRLQKIGEGSIKLEKDKGGEVSGPVAVGTGTAHGEEIELSKLIDILNERFGTEFKPGDQLFFDSIREDAITDTNLRQVALANTMENFGYVFRKTLEGLFIDRMEQNEEMTAKFMNEEQFREIVSQHLLKEVYEQIRSEDLPQAEGRVIPFRHITPSEEDKNRTCVPLYSLKAAAGAFGEAQMVNPDGWVVPNTERPLAEGMFVAQVVGRSMEPRIPDGAWCLFRSPVTGTRQGRIVLVQHQDIHDPDTDASYTVKLYESKKIASEDGDWPHRVIRLLPSNPEYEPIVLEEVTEGEVSVIAELVEVLDAARSHEGHERSPKDDTGQRDGH